MADCQHCEKFREELEKLLKEKEDMMGYGRRTQAEAAAIYSAQLVIEALKRAADNGSAAK